MSSDARSERGFTLIELLLGIFIFSVLSLGSVVLVSNVLTSSNQQGTLLYNQDSVRKVTFNILNELRDAQYGNDGGYPLANAGNQDLVFYSNTDNTADMERVHYYVSGGRLMKGVVKYANGAYNIAAEKAVAAIQDLANGGNPVFFYYDGSYTGSSAQASLSQPVSPTAVKFIEVNLKIYNKAGSSNANYYTVTQGGAIRNLKTNLGN